MADLVSMRADAAALRQDIETILATDGELSVGQVSELDSKREDLERVQDEVHRSESVDAARQALERPTFRFPSADKVAATNDGNRPNLSSRMQFIDNLRAAMRGERVVSDRFLDFASSAGSATGYAASLLPVDLQNEMVRLLANSSAVRKAATIRTYESDVEIPAVSARATITAYTGEGEAFDNFDPQFSKLRIRSYKSAAETLITDEVLADSRGGIVDEVLAQHAEAHGYFFEGKYLGTTAAQGSGNPDGILASSFSSVPGSPTDVTLASTKTAFSDVTYADLVDVAYGMPAAYWGLPKSWIVGPTMFRELLNMVDGDGRPMLLPQATGTAQTGGIDWNLLGHPVYVSDAMPADGAGNFAAVCLERGSYVVADRQGILSSVDPFTNGASGLVAYRSAFRTDGRWIRPTSSARLKTAAS
jgi:HK97 family phage major capsid protein